MACEALELRSTSRLPIKSNKKIRVKLEKECTRNIELQWLLCGIIPNYHSISDFRKQNPSGLKNLFKLFVSFLKDVDLIAGETIAIDGTKSRAHNSKKANFNQKKIDRHLAYIEERTQEYLTQLEQNDIQDNSITVTKTQEKIERLKKNKLHYEILEVKLKASEQPQISTTDQGARALLVQGVVVEIIYNIQAALLKLGTKNFMLRNGFCILKI